MSACDKYRVFDFRSDDDASEGEERLSLHSSNGEEPSYDSSDELPCSDEESITHEYAKRTSHACRSGAGSQVSTSHSVTTYSHEEWLAKHYEAGKHGAARRSGKLGAIKKTKKPKGRRSRKTKGTSKKDTPKRAKAVAVPETEYVVEIIVAHGRAAEMAVKFENHKNKGQLDQYPPETTVYKIRWAGWKEEDDTFEVDAACRDNDLFEKYVEKSCHGLDRYLMPTEETMGDVQERLSLGRRDVTYIGPLKAAAKNLNVHFPRGQRLAASLKASYRSKQSVVMNPLNKDKWRLVYMLLDGGTPGLSTSCDLHTFGRAIFYVGKGHVERPFKHLEEAKDHLLKPDSPEPNPQVERIADIWRSGDGVVVLPVIAKLSDEDAQRREAAIISLKRAGLTNLVNTASGAFVGHRQWKARDWTELGTMELIRAFELYRKTDPDPCYLWNLPLTTDQIEM